MKDFNGLIYIFLNLLKKRILLQEVKDLNGEVESNIVLYQLLYRLKGIYKYNVIREVA